MASALSSTTLRSSVPRLTVSSQRTAEIAVREVYDAYYGQLVGWATSLLSDHDLAQDVVSTAFVRLIRHWGSVSEVRPWLYATVANLVRDHWRKRSREGAAYLRFTGGHVDDVPVSRLDPATMVTVREAVMSLPERLRMPVLLHYYADLPVSDTARQLGKSEGAIKRDLYDARARLATIIGERS